MSIIFDNSEFDDAAHGTYLDPVSGPTFQGFAADYTIKVNGVVNTVGDQVQLSFVDSHGNHVYNNTAIYEGYFTSDGNVYYVFQETEYHGSYSSVAVSFTGQGIVGTASPITPGVPAPCFLRGTRIATPNGDVAIETLTVGDLVTIVDGTSLASAPICWLGHRATRVSRNPGSDEFPIRIRAHAFRDKVPSRDLLVTSEHCVLVDDRLIPVRMLVNGGSIIVDRSITQFEFFHVELERHAILLAEGLEAESYLDTGNRSNFSNHAATNLRADFTVHSRQQKTWDADAAAPLAVDRQTVEPIWQRLAMRAGTLGIILPEAAPTTAEAEVRLVSGGVEIMPDLHDGRVYGFVVPAGLRDLRLVSRSFSPSDVVGPFVDDRRKLGVLVGQIGISQGATRMLFDQHLGEAAPTGWHFEAGSNCRWTNGNAQLQIGALLDPDLPIYIDIEVVGTGSYAARADTDNAVHARVA